MLYTITKRLEICIDINLEIREVDKKPLHLNQC